MMNPTVTGSTLNGREKRYNWLIDIPAFLNGRLIFDQARTIFNTLLYHLVFEFPQKFGLHASEREEGGEEGG